MKHIILRVDNQGVRWNQEDGLPWSATNLPAGAFRFQEYDPVCWEVRLLRYEARRGLLYAEITDYEVPPASFDPRRQPSRPVRGIHFAPLMAEAFKAQLTYYRPGELAAFWAAAPPPESVVLPAAPAAPTAPTAKAPAAHPVAFSFDFLALTIENGGVSGQVVLPGVAEPLPFRIDNDSLLAEFEVIKPFFVRALRRQRIDVKATLVFADADPPRIVRAHSPEIDRIDDKMLQVFRARCLRELFRPEAHPGADQTLFTPDTFFADTEVETPAKALLPTEGGELLREILQLRSVRNARQLRFLAETLHQPGEPLRYVLQPTFGFVFLARGEDGHHFILELLDSHATYIWSIPRYWKSLPEQYRAVEQEIQAIAALGRRAYRRSLRFEHEFWSIAHRHASSELIDGFPRWKSHLLEGLL